MKFDRGFPIAFLVAGTYFMENLDGTVIVTAMPQMARSFGVHAIDLNVGISAYLLTLAVLIPASGWMADRFGGRRLFACAIVVFTIGSVLCGVSRNLAMFTIFRVLQGLGGAMMVPVGRLVVLRNTEKQALMRAIATITWPGLAAPVLGPPLGGFITSYASWRWIFFLNVPLGIGALLLALRLVPAMRGDVAKRFDVAGFVLIGLTCFGFMDALDLLSRTGTSLPLAASCLVASVVLGVLAGRHVRRHTNPIIDPWALRIHSFLVTVRGGSLFRITIGTIPFLVPLVFQLGFGFSAFKTGTLLLVVFAGNLGMKLAANQLLRHFGFRTIFRVAGVLNAAAIFACALIVPGTPMPVIVVILFASGLTRSMLFTAFNTLAFADVPDERMSGANTMFNVAQQMSMGLGIAVGALALRLAGYFWPAPAGAVALPCFQVAFVVTAFLSLAAMLDTRALAPDAGDRVRYRRAALPIPDKVRPGL